MKRILLMLLALAMVVSLAAACQNDEEPEETTGENGDLVDTTDPDEDEEKVQITYYQHSDARPLADAMMDAFNSQSETIEVVTNYVPNDDYDDRIRVLAAGAPEDLDAFFIRQPGEANQYAVNGALLDLTDYLADSHIDIVNYGPLLEVLTIDEQIYSLPRAKGAWLLFYNADIFDAHGLDYPEQMTFDEYADLAAELTYVDGDGNQVWGGYNPPWVFNLGASAAGEYLTDDELPLTREYVQFMDRIYNEDNSHMNIAEMTATASDPNSEFMQGNIAMMINGNWTFDLLGAEENEGNIPFTWDAAPFPIFDGVPQGSTVGGFSVAAVSVGSQNPDEAFEYIEFFCGPDGAPIIAEHGDIPAYATEEATDIYIESTGKEGAKYAFESSVRLEQGTHVAYGAINDAFMEEVEIYLLGEQSLDEAFSNFYELREEILAEYE